MKNERETKTDRDGYTVTKTVKTVTPEDGLVRKRDMYSVNPPYRRGWFKGNAKVVSYSTNNPKITRPFVYGTCTLFFVIGICLWLLSDWMSKFIGACFIGMAIFAFVRAKQDIDAIEKRMRSEEKGSSDEEE